MSIGQHTRREILSQPAAWSAALSAFEQRRAEILDFWARADFDQVIVTGCGSTYYLSLAAAQLLRQRGLHASAVPASELLLRPDAVCLPGARYLLLSISRSGTTTETVRAQENFVKAGGAAICITCDSGSSLAQSADVSIAIDAAQERSVAQTRSFSSMLIAAQLLAGALGRQPKNAGTDLPQACGALLDSCADLMRSLGSDARLESFFFLGAGALYGIACEAMLKMKEMSLAHSEAFHPLEFRHGPMSLVSVRSLVIGLVSPVAAAHELRVLREMQDMGATVLVISQCASEFAKHIALPPDLPAAYVPALHLPPLQLLAFWRALKNGCDPDQPQHLSAVISLDDI
ncbi:MAG: SIS domain-containing protein [Chloroflexi bacterium]|nr:SIS domain-containing protein [Chloroflexota bacterium]MCY3581673.1 SIS domain-containing protein [Chloroflexota bacterium]MCY3714965.1 SIS domain-containing protein [Chloroflexota bacterium]MDE2650893.1 SIS domain-containing protein [Chloroflexota bacterium]